MTDSSQLKPPGWSLRTRTFDPADACDDVMVTAATVRARLRDGRQVEALEYQRLLAELVGRLGEDIRQRAAR